MVMVSIGDPEQLHWDEFANPSQSKHGCSRCEILFVIKLGQSSEEFLNLARSK